VTAEPNDDIQAELNKLTAGTSVDSDLARLKAELGQGAPAPKAIEAKGDA
jgi:phage shock protein A